MSELPIPVSGILTFADDDDWDQWRPAVDEAGIPVLEIAADEAKTAAELFDKIAAALELPDDMPIRKWSGLQDRLWQFLSEADGDRAVIAVRRVGNLATNGLRDFVELTSLLEELGRAGADTDSGFPKELTLTAILTDFGPNFPARS